MGIIYILLTSIFWSFTPVFGKIALKEIDPLLLAFLRLAIATCFFFILYKKRGYTAGVNTIANGWVLLGGIALGLNQSLYIAGLEHTFANVTNIVTQSQVIFLIFLGVVFLREKINLLKGIGIILCFLGIFLALFQRVPLSSLFQSRLFFGNMLIFIAGVCWSFFGFSQKILLDKKEALEVLTSICFVSTVTLGIITLTGSSLEISLSLHSTLSLLFLALVCTGLSYILLSKGLQRLPASTVGMITTATPILTLFTARLILEESITLPLIAGGIVAAIGLTLIALSERENARAT